VTDALLAALAAALDKIEAEAARFDRLGMTGVARRLRALAERLEERATAPQAGGTT
jgi:hypothetical protein